MMVWEPRPVPDVTPETAPFWDATASENLLLCECTSCGLVFYYPRAHCPDCFESEISMNAAVGIGVVYSHTTMESVPGWPERDLPLIVAMVELEEGPRLLTNIVESDLADVEVGAPVEVVFQKTDESLAIPTFRIRA